MPSRSRRQTLRLGSALTLVLTDGRLRTANAKGQILPEGDAYAPWGLWNDPSLRGAPLALVAAAVLAANPHDTQPWLFRISDDAIEVLADLSRKSRAARRPLRYTMRARCWRTSRDLGGRPTPIRSPRTLRPLAL